MLQNFNSPAPPEKLAEYLEENASAKFKYRQRAVLVKHPDDTWHIVCCIVQAFSQADGHPKRVPSRHYGRAILFEGWCDTDSCGQVIADLKSGLLRFDDITLERKAGATWHSEFLSSINPYTDKAGLIVRTQFERDQVIFDLDPLVGGKLPFYASVEEAARDWLPFNEYHGQSDARNREILFLMPEFRAHIASATWSKGVLKIDIDGSDARVGRPLLVKGSYRIGREFKQFESRVAKKTAIMKAATGARDFKCILTNAESRIFDFRDATTAPLVLEPDPSFDRPEGEALGFEEYELSIAGDIPAADRVVKLDHNSNRYRDALNSLSELIDKVEATNDYEDVEDKEQRLAELSAGRRLLEAVRVQRHVVWLLIGSAISWLIEKFSDGFISEVGKVALEAVRKLLGF